MLVGVPFMLFLIFLLLFYYFLLQEGVLLLGYYIKFLFVISPTFFILCQYLTRIGVFSQGKILCISPNGLQAGPRDNDLFYFENDLKGDSTPFIFRKGFVSHRRSYMMQYILVVLRNY